MNIFINILDFGIIGSMSPKKIFVVLFHIKQDAVVTSSGSDGDVPTPRVFGGSEDGH